jgi:hypothetical protein
MKFAAIAAALLVVTAVASADSLKSAVHKMGNKASVALAHKDFKGFEAAIKPFVTPDFKYIEQGNSMGLSQMVEGIKQGVGPMNVTSANDKTLSVTEQGKTGTIMSTHSLTGTMKGPDKKTHKIVARITSKDAWVKVGSTWKMSSMTVVSSKMTRDGKPFDPMAAAPKAKSMSGAKK